MPKRRVVSRPNLLMLVIIRTGYLSISVFLVLLVQKSCDNVETNENNGKLQYFRKKEDTDISKFFGILTLLL